MFANCVTRTLFLLGVEESEDWSAIGVSDLGQDVHLEWALRDNVSNGVQS